MMRFSMAFTMLASATLAVLVLMVPTHQTAYAATRFDGYRAARTVREMAAMGPRRAGSAKERRAVAYLRSRLESYGYTVSVRHFALPGGLVSRNVVARKAGSSPRVLVLGAHLDTKSPSPGANDNASGCSVVLELARVLAQEPTVPTVEFVFFGAEEVVGSNPDAHHFGSRAFVSRMSTTACDNTAGMVSVDMIGYGSTYLVRTMNRGPQSIRYLLLAEARERSIPLVYSRDKGATGWSDHEPFERAGIPAAWLERLYDPRYHTRGDVASRVDREKVRSTGQLLLDIVRELDAGRLERLCAR